MRPFWRQFETVSQDSILCSSCWIGGSRLLHRATNSALFFIFKQVAAITGNKIIYCIAGSIVEIVSVYFSSLAGVVMTLIAVERDCI